MLEHDDLSFIIQKMNIAKQQDSATKDCKQATMLLEHSVSVGTPGSDGAKNEREPGNNVIAAPVETKENPEEVEIAKEE